jgi:hypothetical protein
MSKKRLREYTSEELLTKKTIRTEDDRELKIETLKFRVWLNANEQPVYEGFYQGRWRACSPDGTFR